MPTPVPPSLGEVPRPGAHARFRRLRDLVIVAAAFGMVLGTTVFAHADAPLSRVGRDPTREFDKEVNQVFAAERKAETVPIEASYDGSGEPRAR